MAGVMMKMPSAHVEAQLAAHQQKAAQGARKQTKQAQTPPVPPTSHQQAENSKERQARAAVVGVGRLAWVNPVFGVACHWRKYRLLDAGQAAELDAAFWRITKTTPDPTP